MTNQRGFYLVDPSEKPLGVDNNTLRATVAKLFAQPTFKPPLLPDVAQEVLALSQKPQTGLDSVTRLLEKDSLLTGKVLKKARTALYASTMPIRTLRDALVRLGMNAVFNLVMEAALDIALFNAPAYAQTMRTVRTHLLAVAHTSRLVARRTTIDAEHAFLVGLLHDVGFPIGLIALSKLDGVPKRANTPADLYELLHDNHEALSKWMVKTWGLPQELEMLLEQHHRWHLEKRAHPVHLILCIAETLAIQADMGVEKSSGVPTEAREHPSELSLQRCLTELRLNDAVWANLQREAAEQLAVLRKHVST